MTTTTYYAYLFEAHSIQHYVMQGGKLADMVGASELLEWLIGESGPLDDAIKQLGFQERNDYHFSRRGGAAFYLLFRNEHHANKLRDVWSLLVPQLAPGLPWNHAVAEGQSQKQAIDAAKTCLAEKRNQPVRNMPEANPLMRRNARTGNPAITLGAKDGKPLSLDAATVAKQKFKTSGRLFEKFMSENLDTKSRRVFPRNMERSDDDDGETFPYKNDNHTIGLIHADGNGLGQILMNLSQKLDDSDEYADTFYRLSLKIDKATRNAAKKALTGMDEIKNLSGVLPIRPIILGGDDLTVIIRGDLAIEYAREFLRLFEQETKNELKGLHQKYPELIPDYMTACAGIAFIRSNQPFYLGYQLAESLCAHAKTASRQTQSHTQGGKIPASLAFYHATTSMIPEYSEVIRDELTVQLDQEAFQMSLGTYGLADARDEHAELPSLAALHELKRRYQTKDIARGSARHLLTLMHTNPADAVQAYARWREMMQSNKETNSVLEDFDQTAQLLFQTAKERHDNLPFADFAKADDASPQYRTFIGDLSRWIAIEGEPS